MSTILIDTNVYSSAMRGETSSIELVRQAQSILVCPIVLGELYAGFKRGSRDKENLKILKEFLQSPRIDLIQISPDTAEYYSLLYALLREAGTPIPTNDMWIAACAMEHGATLVSRDKHFTMIPGLKITQPD